MSASLPLPHSTSHTIRWRTFLHHITKVDRQVLLDRLAVFAALLLVLATLTMSALYVAHELPRWKAGQIGGFEAISAPVMQDSAPSSDDTTAVHAPTVNRVPLVVISMAIEMAIFVGLGLYLRHEADQLP